MAIINSGIGYGKNPRVRSKEGESHSHTRYIPPRVFLKKTTLVLTGKSLQVETDPCGPIRCTALFSNGSPVLDSLDSCTF